MDRIKPQLSGTPASVAGATILVSLVAAAANIVNLVL